MRGNITGVGKGTVALLAGLLCCSPVLAIDLLEGQSIWIVVQAPAEFSKMTLFWGVLAFEPGADMDYNVFRPLGFAGGMEPPLCTDLDPFKGNYVVFEIKSNRGWIQLRDNAYVWDYTVIGGMVGYSGYPFYFGFYDRHQNLALHYAPGQILPSEPGHGTRFVHYPMTGFGAPTHYRSDFTDALAIDVRIDIRPGDYPNPVKPGIHGVIPVAILGSPSFSVGWTDVASIWFGPAAALPAHDLTSAAVYADHLQDVNLDGYNDLVTHFRVDETGIVCGHTSAALKARVSSCRKFRASDTLQTVGCR